MKRITLGLLLSLSIVSCASRRDTAQPEVQSNFGVQMAKLNLWREAMFRFDRAVKLDPGDAMAHNNLAVAYEANGDFDKAATHYREAMRLDRSNTYIQKNYSRFTEFMGRNRKRQGQTARDQRRADADARIPSDATPADNAPVAQPAPQPAPAPVPPPTPNPPGGAR